MKTLTHSAFIISTLFRKAESVVEIVASNLDDEIWGVPEVYYSAISFIKKNYGNIRIIVKEHVSVKRSGFLKAISKSGLIRNIKLFAVSTKLQSEYEFEFIVVDRRHLRWEPNVAKSEAVVKFGDAESGGKLSLIFKGLADGAKEIQLKSEKQKKSDIKMNCLLGGRHG